MANAQSENLTYVALLEIFLRNKCGLIHFDPDVMPQSGKLTEARYLLCRHPFIQLLARFLDHRVAKVLPLPRIVSLAITQSS
jgi:hypothetical protein